MALRTRPGRPRTSATPAPDPVSAAAEVASRLAARYLASYRHLASNPLGRIAVWLALAQLWLFLLVNLWMMFHMGWYYIAHAQAPGMLYDFKIFYGAIFDWHACGSLYHVVAHLPFARAVDPNNNPPMAELAFVPLAHLPLVFAGGLFEAVGLAGFGLAITLLWRTFRAPRSWHLCGTALTLVVTGHPMRDALYLSNWALVIAALDVLAWWCLRTGRDRWAGVVLGCDCALKWQPGLLLLYCLATRRWANVR